MNGIVIRCSCHNWYNKAHISYPGNIITKEQHIRNHTAWKHHAKSHEEFSYWWYGPVPTKKSDESYIISGPIYYKRIV